MKLVIDLMPQEEARFRAFARQQGADPTTLARQMITQPLAPSQSSMDSVDAENMAAIAKLDAWLEQDATDDPEELRNAAEDLAEFKRNINANRAETGEPELP